MPQDLYWLLLWIMTALAPLVFLVLLFISAPYGRHIRDGWGPSVSSRTGWIVMEAPACLLMLAMFAVVPVSPVIYFLLLLWQVHYFHRAFIYPLTTRSRKQMPVAVVLMAIVFNAANATLNGWHFVYYAHWYDVHWLVTPYFIAGFALFCIGYWVTKRSDRILRELRTESSQDYHIPRGFLYRWISCPNYLGESLQWLGWALMVMSPAAWVFLLWTIANLLPRAISHHRWYLENFTDYPSNRRAFIPYLI